MSRRVINSPRGMAPAHYIARQNYPELMGIVDKLAGNLIDILVIVREKFWSGICYT